MKTVIYLATVCSLLLIAPMTFALQVNLTPGISVGETYTDNLFLTENDPKDEFITTIAPSARLELLGKLSGAELFYEPSYAYYQEFDERNTWRHNASLNGWSQITRNNRIEIRDNLTITDDPLSEADIARLRTQDPTIPIDPTIRRGRNQYTRNYAAANYRYQFGRNDSFRLGYRHRLLDNEDPAIEDSSAHTPSAGLTYWFLPRWGLDLDLSYTRGEYDVSDDITQSYGTMRLIRKFSPNLDGYVRYSHSIIDYDGAREDAKIYNPSLGMDYRIQEDISLTAELGYFFNDFDRREDQDGVTGNLLLVKRFKRGSLNLALLGGYDYQVFATTQENGFEKFFESSLSGTYRFTRYLAGSVSGTYRYDDYIIQGYENDQYRGTVGLTATPLRWMNVSLNYAYRMLDSTGLENYDENRVYLRISLAPAVPYRF